LDLLGPVSPLPAFAAVLIAFGTAALLLRRFEAPPVSRRFASIDGLRGYLAFGVFLHHACIWFFYQRDGQWKLPPSQLYVHLGHGSVALFFMITGFLFFSKLIDARGRPLDWLRLFVSRVMRLVPLYLVVMLALFATVAVLSGGELHEPARTVIKQALRWLSFTMFGNPPINQVAITKIIVAGVTWSLPYEWFFYGSLPLLALSVGVRARWPWLLVGLASVAGLLNWHALPVHLCAFVGGVAAAWAVRWPWLCRLATGRGGSAVVVLAIAAMLGCFPLASDYGVVALLGLAFTMVACGNTLFGFLLHPASRLLGETAYSLYLLHGMLLFGLFHFMLAVDAPGAALTPVAHWAWVLALSPIVVLVSFASFHGIEAPAMRATSAVTAALRRQLQKSLDRLAA
jgi:peptidoglycan/LPS O-acetylase OafA/YrhL